MKTIAILFGGSSDEHIVSITSTKYLSELLSNFQLEYYYFDSQNNIFKINVNQISDKSVNDLTNPINLSDFISNLKNKIAFPINYGKCAEDGKLYAFLELYGIETIGGDYKSYSIAFDKLFTKYFLNAIKIKTPEFKHYSIQFTSKSEIIKDIQLSFKKPIIFKPRSNGSSIGMTLIKELSENEIDNAIEEVLKFEKDIICEEFVENFKEYQIAVIQSNNDYFTSSVVEITCKSEFLTYEEKFNSNSTVKYIPLPETEKDLFSQIEIISIEIMKQLQLKHFLRMDFLYSQDNKTLYVNEISPMFGMTKESAFWKLWRAKGQNDLDTVNLILTNFR